MHSKVAKMLPPRSNRQPSDGNEALTYFSSSTARRISGTAPDWWPDRQHTLRMSLCAAQTMVSSGSGKRSAHHVQLTCRIPNQGIFACVLDGAALAPLTRVAGVADMV